MVSHDFEAKGINEAAFTHKRHHYYVISVYNLMFVRCAKPKKATLVNRPSVSLTHATINSCWSFRE